MNVIYKPRGRALEYALLACNLYGVSVRRTTPGDDMERTRGQSF